GESRIDQIYVKERLLSGYLIWYNEKRIKVSLGNMSPKEYRQSLGLAGY
ncbi:MAG TPA: IS3 family transposase, partial [Bacillota bacterium]|nr:IS3 family transposase [Bacillota bacterium]